MGRVYNKDEKSKESSTKLLSKLDEKSFTIQKRKVRRSNDLNSSISSHSKSLNWSYLNESVNLDDPLADDMKAPRNRYKPPTTSTGTEKKEVGNEDYNPRKYQSSKSFLGMSPPVPNML